MSALLTAYADTVTVTDGSWSTQLATRGFPVGTPAELANTTQGHLVVELARDYLSAGAQVLTTNTFAANRLALARHKLKVDIAELNRLGAQLARQAASQIHGPLAEIPVAGVIGPSGRILAVKEAGEDELSAAFAEAARALAEGGATWIVLETFSELAEALLALRAVRSAVKLPVIVSLSFDSGPQRSRTMMNVEAGEAATALDQAGADALGCNCGAGVAQALPAVVALRAHSKLPLWVKPSAGLPELDEGRMIYSQTPDDFGEFVPNLLEAGANFVGGCCGAGPEHIRRIAALVQSRRKSTARRGARGQ